MIAPEKLAWRKARHERLDRCWAFLEPQLPDYAGRLTGVVDEVFEWEGSQWRLTGRVVPQGAIRIFVNPQLWGPLNEDAPWKGT